MQSNDSDGDDEVDDDGATRHLNPIATHTLHTLAHPPRTPTSCLPSHTRVPRGAATDTVH